jgi:paraquat-inducible protein B
MSKQISKTVIGGFMVSAMVLLVAAVMIFGSGRFFKKTYEFVLFFDGSIKGLKVGSPVTHRGVHIGSVKKISIHPDPREQDSLIPVVISIERENVENAESRSLYEEMPSLIERGLKGQLTIESLVTGQLMVDLDFHPDRPIQKVGLAMEYQEIPTIPSAIERLAHSLKDLRIKELFEKLESTVDAIENIASNPKIAETIHSLNVLLKDADKVMLNIDAKVETVGTSADKTLKDYGKLARDVDRKVEPLATGIDETMSDTRKLVRNVNARVDPVAASLKKAADEATETMVQAKETLAMVDEDSELSYELNNLIREMTAAARSIRVLADYFERHPDALMQGKGGK